MDWLDTGYFALFIATFLAATVVPFSSEAVLAAMLAGGFDPVLCFLVASSGNWLGGMSSYGLGWLGNVERIQKWLRTDLPAIEKWQPRITRYGSWAALLCWLPFVGDIIAVALGVFRINPLPVAALMLAGKAFRYAALVWAASAYF